MSDLNTIDSDINAFLTANVGGETKDLIEFYNMKLERAKMHIALLQSLKDFKGNELVAANLLSDIEIEIVKEAFDYLLKSHTNVLAVLRLFTESMLANMDHSCLVNNAGDPMLNRYKVMVSVNTVLKEADFWYNHNRHWWLDILSPGTRKEHFMNLFRRANDEPNVAGKPVRRNIILTMQKLTS